VTLLGDEHGHLRAHVGEAEAQPHGEAIEQGLQPGPNLPAIQGEPLELELDPLEEHALLRIGVLLGMDDVPVPLGNKPRHRRDDPRLIRTGEQQNRVRFLSHA
jgi:hypothetical protein